MLRRSVGIGIGIGIAIAVALGWWAFSSFKEKPDAPDVGDCVIVSGTSTAAEAEEADCGSDDVLYQVVSDDGDCAVIEVRYTGEVDGSDPVDLCLEWEVEAGSCVRVGTVKDEKDEKVDCEATKGDTDVFEVVSVEDGASGTCAKKKELPRANRKRDQLTCLVPNA